MAACGSCCRPAPNSTNSPSRPIVNGPDHVSRTARSQSACPIAGSSAGIRWLSTSRPTPASAAIRPASAANLWLASRCSLQPRAIAGARDQPVDALGQHRLMHQDIRALGEVRERREECRVGRKDNAAVRMIESQSETVAHRRMVDAQRGHGEVAVLHNASLAELLDAHQIADIRPPSSAMRMSMSNSIAWAKRDQ